MHIYKPAKAVSSLQFVLFLDLNALFHLDHKIGVGFVFLWMGVVVFSMRLPCLWTRYSTNVCNRLIAIYHAVRSGVLLSALQFMSASRALDPTSEPERKMLNAPCFSHPRAGGMTNTLASSIWGV